MIKVIYGISRMVKRVYLLAAVAFMLMPFRAMALEGDIRVHDPDIIKSGDNYYIFSTGLKSGVALEARVSYDNGITWVYLGDVFPTRPDWTDAYLGDRDDFWAPDIKYFNGKYHLYYSVSATFGAGNTAIGLATNTTLDPNNISRGWVNLEGPVVTSTAEDDYNTIDPNVFIDDDGIGWLSYGSFWSGIKLAQIDISTGMIINNTTTNIASKIANWTSGDNPIEAPYIVKKGDYYYLYVSFDYCCPSAIGIANVNYKVAVGRADVVTGLYLDKNGTDMMQGGGTIVVKRDFDFVGKGHNAVYQENGIDYLVYHVYEDPYPGPQLMISVLDYDQDGWPAAGPFNGFGNNDALGSGPFKIVNLQSKKCLDVADSSSLDEANVQQWTCDGGSDQLWSLQFLNGDYSFINENSNKALDSRFCGFGIQQFTTYTSDDPYATCQQFKLRPSPTTVGYYEIINQDKGNEFEECLDVSYSPDVRILLCEGLDYQQWRLEPLASTITATAGTDGSISPSGVVTVNNGADQTFTITPDTGFSVTDVLVDGVSVGAVATYTFINVTTNHTISAAFADTTGPNVTITSPQLGDIVPGNGFEFTGTAEDVSGVAEVRIYVFDYGKLRYTIIDELATYNPSTKEWSFSVLSTHITPERKTGLWVHATDNAGYDTWVQIEVNVENWYDTNWLYRQKITISSNMTTKTDQTDFPLLIRIPAGNQVFAKAQSSGQDILFTSPDHTTKLYHEIEKFDNTSGSEELVAWVNISSLSSSTDTVIYMYYGNLNAPTQENPQGVWDSSYKGVWHLKEKSAGTGSLDLYKDSTSNNNDGDDYISATGQEGQINSGKEFDGINDYIAVPHNTNLNFGTADFTVSLWAKLDNIGAPQYLINKYPGSRAPGFHISMDSGGRFWVMEHGNTVDFSIAAGPTINDSTWHYLTYVRHSDTGIRELWIDGVWQNPDDTTNYGANNIDTTDRMVIGGRYTNPASAWVQGEIDEVRLSGAARSADWIQASYNNQNDPERYTILGTEENITY